MVSYLVNLLYEVVIFFLFPLALCSPGTTWICGGLGTYEREQGQWGPLGQEEIFPVIKVQILRFFFFKNIFSKVGIHSLLLESRVGNFALHRSG
jgi:hypothetical protein